MCTDYINLYTYCYNLPVTLVDKYGYDGETVQILNHSISTTSKGFSTKMAPCFLLKNHVLDFSKTVISKIGSNGKYKTMNKTRIAKEVLAHAVLYYIGRGISLYTVISEYVSSKVSWVLDNITKVLLKLERYVLRYMSNYLCEHGDPIDVNYDESSFRMFVYNIIWRMIGTIDGICSIVRNIPKIRIRPFIIPYRPRIRTKILPFIVSGVATTYL